MKIVTDYPPNIEKIKEVFDFTGKVPCFTYGDTLYNPSGNPVSASLLAHEEVHVKQQGDDPESWWDRYLVDVPFRLEQEIEGYKAQYKEAKKWIKDRNELFRYARGLAHDLSSPMYGNIINSQEALTKICKN